MLGILEHALVITGFVFVMMLVVEYVNVLTRGAIQQHLPQQRWSQLLLAAGLGITPGCLGAFVVVTLYAHRALSLHDEENCHCFPRGQILAQWKECTAARGLLASSIVQDGHGMLPLLAHSRKAFFLVKAVNLLVGVALGTLLLALGM